MRLFLASILIMTFVPVGVGQISFFKLFSNNGYDFGYGVVQHEDSSYMICGSSSSFIDGPSQAFMLKIDSLGSYLWSSHYGGSESDMANRVLYKKDFGYFLAGYTNSFGNGAYDFYMVKTDMNGVQEWQKTYGGPEWERVNDAALTRDTGTILVGQTNSWTGGDQDIYIVRTDISGDTLWTKRIGGIGDDIAHSIVQYNDSTFFIGGELYIEDSLQTKGFVMRIIDNGIVQWFDTIGFNGVQGIYDLDVDPFHLNFVGYWFDPVAQYKKDFYGFVTFENTYVENNFVSPPTGNDWFREHVTTYGFENKKYIAGKFKNASSELFGYDVAFARVGSSLWWDNSSSTLAYAGDDDCGQLIPTSDGGVLFVGFTSTLGSGGANVFVEKIGPGDIHPLIDTSPLIDQLVFVNELNLPSDFKVYPNPASDELVLVSSKDIDFEYVLINMHGREVRSGSHQAIGYIDISGVNSGVYLLKVWTGENSTPSVVRIMVK